MRANPRWVNIPFIFLTARTASSDVRYAEELGVDAYLTKPISPPDLLATIRDKLRLANPWRSCRSRVSAPAAC